MNKFLKISSPSPEEPIGDLYHVVHEVEFDDGLGLDHVVEHGGVHVAHRVAAH